ncbi:pyridoxamine 5'-phosphate oxidase family protein [Streptomyces rapamycinicus]|uniref:Pyridoxamine 5'-phosphate oxidase n=2 Tax=Streptomyces rapamycinicus TaxID=1226757 RepID=A0A0A0NSM4_STRRN|nr:TIGR03618 family F420-dependent PPOX class oxidoreductase [Streptomyces rapamycinicus]AGP60421.1 pyridoxamine 5'-phosphate oxidase [Streptomyces rapamycinicus NRRL 5491]MBB4788415.1 PPOX class probable F420-dependent enzyme [Streptomyces rapamycinicus]RLV72750.1 pyridoxamine 5'-phosphate oxidase [Streptomyces rapamycinicus NRRL 5491]UTP35988.1 TIGR03618 family F420-dependent PPOX class oxidoreductase [Streptomyces rapamycinicus NRRL 5491]
MMTTEDKSPASGAETKPGAGPAPRVLTEEELSRTLRDQRFGVLATVKRSGHPHLSTVIHQWSPGERVLRVSSTADRLKVRQLRRDPRAAVHVGAPDGWSFAVAEGEAEVSEVTAVAGDAVGRELLSMTPGFADPHDETAFLEQLVADRRVVIRIRVSRLYGTALDLPTT